MSPNIKAVGFDFSGVIELYPPGRLLTTIAELFNIPLEQFQTEYFKQNHLSHVQNQNFADVVVKVASAFSADSQTEDKIKNIIRDRQNKSRLNRELILWFSALKQKGFKVGILSNYTTDLTDKLKLAGIYDLVDAVVVSSEIGFQKPDREAFSVLFERLGVLPEETIFIDDASRSLEKAPEIGYYPILFKDNDHLRKDLQGFGIEL
jgi:putative hydrolase of the HAD superfamily